MAKQEYIRCPRCELNWIKIDEKLCQVCKDELRYDASKADEFVDEDEFVEEEEMEICPVCKINYITAKEKVCETCKKVKFADMEASDKDEWESIEEEKLEPVDLEEEEFVSLNAMQEEEFEESEKIDEIDEIDETDDFGNIDIGDELGFGDDDNDDDDDDDDDIIVK